MKRKGFSCYFPAVCSLDKFEGFLVDFTATSGITKEKFAFWLTKTFALEDLQLVKNERLFFHNGQLKLI